MHQTYLELSLYLNETLLTYLITWISFDGAKS